MKASEIKALSQDELPKRLNEKQRELFELRLKASTKQLKKSPPDTLDKKGYCPPQNREPATNPGQ